MASSTEAAGPVSEQISPQYIIKEGDQVMLKKGKNIKIFQIRKHRQVWLEKAKFTLDGTIGHPYGTTFEVKGGKMIKVEKPTLSEKETVAEGGKDNRDLLDLDSNQKLTRDDIEKMKKEGIKGKDIIDQLIENSSTFQSKTVFAQAKWIKKKKIKHLLEFTILKPSARLLCEMHHAKNPSRICFMRVDSLAQILSRGNVKAHSTVAVVDSCLGLVVGAVMERMGGFGKVIHIHHGTAPVRPALDSFDFPKEFLDNLHSYPLDRVNSLEYDQTKSEDSKVKPDTSISSNDNCTNTAVQSELTEATNVGTNSANKTKSENTTVDTNSAIKTESMDATNSAIKTESVEATNVDTKTAEEMETLESTVSGDTNSKCGAGDCVLDSVPCQQSVTVTEDTQGDTDNKAQVCTSLRKSTENVATQGDTEASRKSTENGDTQGDRENHVQGSTSSEEPTARTADAECGTEDMDTGPRETPGGSGQTELGQDGANSDDKAKRKRNADREAHRQAREQKMQEARELILEKNIDCLIVACKFHVTPIVLALLKYVAPSRPVVVFGQYKEPILDCYEYLRKEGGMVNFRVTEAWLREYQVMDMRTHPEITMSGGGGYLLTATTIVKP